ncbi:hypothetical protein K3495_g5089 [Podosphaera aphanis]|nr:hypothetical protein K3495_g5089 [Podosphaera aphanis]
MAFLFKSKKHADKAHAVKDGSAVTSSSPTTLQNGNVRHNDRIPANQSTPGSSVNNSITSLQNGPPGPPSPEQINGRRGVAQEQAQDLTLRNATAPAVQPISPPNPISYLYPWSQVRLTFVSAAQGPFPRYGAAVNSAASKDGCIYLMGGLINSSMVRGDLWMVEAGGKMICYPVQTTAEGPGPRVGHAGLLVGNAFIVYGGDTKMEDSDILDETLYLLNTSTRQWSKAKPAGPRPAGRYGHTLNILGSKIYIFGGQVEGYFMNDLVAFDLNQLQVPTNRWEMLIRNSDDGGPATGSVPAARTNHTIVTYNEKLYLFGGTNGYQWFNDVWCYNPTPNTWTSLECIGYIPAPREGHAAAIVDDVMYIFGGRTEDGSDLGDLAAFRITSRRWYTFQNMGPSPSPRSGHSMTACGAQIVVLGGEPSTAIWDSNDLTIAYILDTNKIRYPNDYPTQIAPSGGRRPSVSEKALPASSRGISSRDTPSASENKRISGLTGRGNDQPSFDGNNMNESNSGLVQSQVTQPGQIGSSSKLPRATVTQAASSPPQPQSLALRSNSTTPTTNGRPRIQGQGRHETARSTSIDITTRNGDGSTVSSSHISQVSKDTSRESSTTTERKTSLNKNNSVTKTVSGEAGPPVSMNTLGSGSMRSSSRNRFQRQQGSIDSTNDQSSLRNFSTARHTSPPPSNRQIINPLVRKGSARNSQTVSVLKELDAAKNRNAWYASELELARKAGYTPTTTNPVDHRTAETFDDEDKPLIEALIAMKTELANVQGSIDTQAVVTAKKIAEIENQRDSAIREAVYAKAKLAAYGGVQSNTPPPDCESRDLENVTNSRSEDISRKLANMLGEKNELQNKIEMLNSELESEKRNKKLAEEIATSSQDRLSELEAYKQQNSAEVEHLKAELHELQVRSRREAIEFAEAVASAQLLQAEKEEVVAEYQKLSSSSENSKQTLENLKSAVESSMEIRETLQRLLDHERRQGEELASQLAKLRSEHETCKSELEITTQKLRDMEELAEKHASENKFNWQAIQAGLNQLISAETSSPSQANHQKNVVLQAQTEAANALARNYQAAADSASEKLRSAEERIAGLEAYQEQTSREGMSIRKQLQNTMREIQTLQAANNEMKYQIANQQLETNAVYVQHNTLKEILDERGLKPMSKPRAQSISSSTAAPDTHSLPQIRELEQQLSASLEAHEETKQIFEARELEAERAYREKLAQLDNDYQSAVKYVKGTEKMLKRLNDELAKYKSDNIRLKEQVIEVKEKAATVSEADEWKTERSELQRQIKSLQDEIKVSVKQLENQMAQVREELSSAEKERDTLKVNQQEAQNRAQLELENLQSENSVLQQRAQEAERKVSLLLDQVEQSVDIYRRHSRPVDLSVTPTATSNSTYQRAILTADSASENSFDGTNRNSMALDSLASELETLRSHWQNTNKNYRLSNAFDFDDRPAPLKGQNEALTSSNYVEDASGSLADWRKRLDSEEANLNNHAGVVSEGIRSPVFAKREMDPSEVSVSHGDKGEINAI